MPYYARHSGASIDLCCEYRSNRGREESRAVGSEKSMLGYDRSAKLAQSLKQFDSRQLDCYSTAESRLEALFFGRVQPMSFCCLEWRRAFSGIYILWSVEGWSQRGATRARRKIL